MESIGVESSDTDGKRESICFFFIYWSHMQKEVYRNEVKLRWIDQVSSGKGWLEENGSGTMSGKRVDSRAGGVVGNVGVECGIGSKKRRRGTKSVLEDYKDD